MIQVWPANAPSDLTERWNEALQGLADAPSPIEYQRQCNALFMIYTEMEARRPKPCEHEWGLWHHNHNGGGPFEHDWRECANCKAIEKKFTHTAQLTLQDRYGTIEVK